MGAHGTCVREDFLVSISKKGHKVKAFVTFKYGVFRVCRYFRVGSIELYLKNTDEWYEP